MQRAAGSMLRDETPRPCTRTTVGAAWMGAANLENRHVPGGIDARVLAVLRGTDRTLTDS